MSDELKVLSVMLVIWAGIFLYLLKIDADVRRLKRGRDDR